MIRLLRTLLLTVFIILPCAACASTTTRAPNPLLAPQPDYPCGVDGVSCGGKFCCNQNETCGGAFPSVGCPAGQCCFVGTDGVVRRTGVQRPASGT